MTGIIVTIISCIVAIVGFVHSHAVPEGNKGLFGLSRLGVALILLSAAGGAVGVVKAVSDAKGAAADREWRERTISMLQVVYVQLTGLQAPADPALRKQLAQATDQISAVATMSRGSDFSMSDFTGTEFRYGKFFGADFEYARFEGASFREAQFEGADFSGADLSSVTISATTRLPKGTRREYRDQVVQRSRLSANSLCPCYIKGSRLL